MRSAVLPIAIVLWTLPVAVEGQRSATDPRPAFEVASVKENRSGTTDWSFGAEPGGRWSMVNSPIATLIREAYPV